MFENNDVQQISDRKAIAGLTQIKSYAQKSRMTFSVPDYSEESLDSASKYPQSKIQNNCLVSKFFPIHVDPLIANLGTNCT